jgi:hypothetical protein
MKGGGCCSCFINPMLYCFVSLCIHNQGLVGVIDYNEPIMGLSLESKLVLLVLCMIYGLSIELFNTNQFQW